MHKQFRQTGWALVGLVLFFLSGCNQPQDVPIPDRFYLAKSNCFGVMKSRTDTSFEAELICDQFHYKSLHRSQDWIWEKEGDQIRKFKVKELADSLGVISKAIPLRRDRFKQHIDTLHSRMMSFTPGNWNSAKRMYTLRYSMWVDITDVFILEDSIEVNRFYPDNSLIVYQPSTGEEVFLVMSDGGVYGMKRKSLMPWVRIWGPLPH
ncbi:hypothetical protein KFE98_16515 [bacterium SCSIO 12741]|nr:hypothetical protein KFE98_16515 [bacterium SCSIO 12741]